MKKKDPTSHRIIEKRRRDRMNNCLADLSRLIPTHYMKKGRARVEKTEIIEMAIRHLKDLIETTQNTQLRSETRQQHQHCRTNSVVVVNQNRVAAATIASKCNEDCSSNSNFTTPPENSTEALNYTKVPSNLDRQLPSNHMSNKQSPFPLALPLIPQPQPQPQPQTQINPYEHNNINYLRKNNHTGQTRRELVEADLHHQNKRLSMLSSNLSGSSRCDIYGGGGGGGSDNCGSSSSSVSSVCSNSSNNACSTCAIGNSSSSSSSGSSSNLDEFNASREPDPLNRNDGANLSLKQTTGWYKKAWLSRSFSRASF